MTCAHKKGTAFPDFIKALPEIDIPLAGARGWMMQGTGQQVVFVEFPKTVDVPDHNHEDQWELPVAGRVELRRKGGTEKYGAGDAFFIPAGEVHGATVHAGYRAIIAFNAPDRYKPKG